MSEWKEYNVGELVESISDTYKFNSDQIIFLNTSDVYEGKVLNHIKFRVTELPGQAKKRIQKGDILFSEIRPANRRYAFIDFDAKDYVVSTKLMVLRTKPKLDSKYFFYFITSNNILTVLQNIAENRSGTFPQITFDNVAELEICLPDLDEQKEIAVFINNLDDKISLLHRQNQTLEQIARALFKRWFVEFEFPFDFAQGKPNEHGQPYKSSGGKMAASELGEIPEGWRVGRLKDFGNVVCGKTPSKSVNEFFGGGISFIKIPDMHGKMFVMDTEDKLTQQGANSQSNKYIPPYSLNVSCIATVGLVTINSKKCQTNQQINSIILNQIFHIEYLYFALKDLSNYLLALGSGGSATMNVNTNTFSNIEIFFPDNEILRKYHELANNLFKKIELNYYSIKNLSETRNTLLPKLMSGQIRVKP